MQVTRVHLEKLDRRGDTVARGMVTIDDSLIIHGVRLVSPPGRKAFVAMPSKSAVVTCPHCGYKPRHDASYCGGCGRPVQPGAAEVLESRYLDVVHPINRDARAALEQAVFAEYVRCG